MHCMYSQHLFHSMMNDCSKYPQLSLYFHEKTPNSLLLLSSILLLNSSKTFKNAYFYDDRDLTLFQCFSLITGDIQYSVLLLDKPLRGGEKTSHNFFLRFGISPSTLQLGFSSRFSSQPSAQNY